MEKLLELLGPLPGIKFWLYLLGEFVIGLVAYQITNFIEYKVKFGKRLGTAQNLLPVPKRRFFIRNAAALYKPVVLGSLALATQSLGLALLFILSGLAEFLNPTYLRRKNQELPVFSKGIVYNRKFYSFKKADDVFIREDELVMDRYSERIVLKIDENLKETLVKLNIRQV